jgi:hypothetical protein
MALNSIPIGATVCTAENWPIPAAAEAVQHRDACDIGRNLFEQFQPFRADRVFERGKAGGIPTGPRHPRDQAGTHWIDDLRKDDWHGARCPLQFHHRGGGNGQDDIRSEPEQFGSIRAIVVCNASGPARLDADVPPISPAQLLQSLPEHRQAGFPFRMVGGDIHQHADAPHALLCD